MRHGLVVLAGDRPPVPAVAAACAAASWASVTGGSMVLMSLI
nr:hypothetical protein [Streptomyces sp. RPA4-2]